MRLFVAVELHQSVRAAARETAESLRNRIDPQIDARWVSTERMHLTVRFIGQCDDQRAPAIIEALRPPLPVRPFEIELGPCGVFPAKGPLRVFWIGLSAGSPSLHRLHEECNRRLLPLGFPAEARPFTAHLTLARVKEAPPESARAAREAVREVRAPGAPSTVTAVTLFQSHLSSKGSTHTPLLEVPLGS